MNKVVCLLLIIVGTSCITPDYVVLKPVVLAGDKLVEIEPDENFYYNVKRVLDFYDEDYKVDGNGVVLITEQLSADKDLLMNYTNKANDPDWMEMNGR